MRATSAELRDGTRVVLRPVTPEDRDAVREGFERLSPESRYRRFFSPMPRLTERQLDFLTRLDHHDHEALLAIDPGTRGGVGVARYVRIAPDEAEPAVVVADDWQGRGLGTVLLDRLATRAREEGIARFRAAVLAENDAAIAALARLGETVHRSAGREIEIEISLVPARDATGVLGSTLRAAAEGAVQPVLTIAHRLGWRPRAQAADRAARAPAVVTPAGRERDRPALRCAGELAIVLGASLEVVVPGAGRRSRHEEGPSDDLQELRDRGLRLTVHERHEDAATALVDVAADRLARLIVVPAPERGAGPRLRPGRLCDVVVATAPCDVLLVRDADAAEPARDTPEPSPGSSAG